MSEEAEQFVPTYQGAKYHCVHCGKDWEVPDAISTTSERMDYLCLECKQAYGEVEVLLDIVENGKRCLIAKTTFTYRSSCFPYELKHYPFTDIHGDCQICGSFPCEHGKEIGVV